MHKKSKIGKQYPSWVSFGPRKQEDSHYERCKVLSLRGEVCTEWAFINTNNCFCHWCNWKCLYLPEETFKYDKLIKTHEGKLLKCILFSVIGFTPVYIASLQLQVILIHKSNYLYITVLFYFLRWCVFTQCLFWPSYNCLDLPFTSVVFSVSYVARKENLGYQVLKLNLAW